MHSKRRYFVLTAALSLALLATLGPGNAFACSCVQQPVKKRIKPVDAAAEVKVLKVRKAGFEPGPGGEVKETWFKVRVIRVHKGPKRLRKAETARIYTGQPINSCSWAPRRGAKLGLFLSRHGRDWYAGLCDVVGRKALRKGAGGKAASASCGAR